MKLNKFLKEKGYVILSFLILYFVLLLMFVAFKIDSSLLIATTILLHGFLFNILMIEYWRKRKFYTDLIENIKALDKAYFVLETLEKPEFYEGELLFNALYEINKSMNEMVKLKEEQMRDYKEYIEMWIHEVKIPISSLLLMAHNHAKKFDKKTIEQIRRINDNVEQVLFYARQESAEKDYLIKKVTLSKIISLVALKNKDDLLENKIDFLVMHVNEDVYTDAKWLEFILNQIVNNSIKYRNKKGAYIRISSKDESDRINLIIEDNGIGIESADLPRVFDKTFTGKNGHNLPKSTGMGLFIVKNLCTKLGHKIEITSKVNVYTKVVITFYKNQFYAVVKKENR